MISTFALKAWTVGGLLALPAASVHRTPGQVHRSQAAGPVRVVRNIAYTPEAGYTNDKNKLDLYLPEGRTGFPVIVSLHGGALQEGDKREHAHIGQRFAAAGIGTVIVNYRLSPGVAHPVHVQDAAKALAWVKRHIAEYGGDTGAVFIIGHSAGAYLAALLATDSRYLAAHGLDTRAIRGVVPVSAFYYVERVAPDRPRDVWGADPAAWPDASPGHHLRPGLPPMLLVYADGDDAWRRDQNEEMAKAIRAAGNADVAIHQVAGRDHYTIWGKIAPGDEVSHLIEDFVTQHMATRRR